MCLDEFIFNFVLFQGCYGWVTKDVKPRNSITNNIYYIKTTTDENLQWERLLVTNYNKSILDLKFI